MRKLIGLSSICTAVLISSCVFWDMTSMPILSGIAIGDDVVSEVRAAGNYAYCISRIADSTTSTTVCFFNIFDVSDVFNIERLSSTIVATSDEFGTPYFLFDVSGNYAYLHNTDGISTIDISNPQSPLFLTSNSVNGSELDSDLFVSDNFAYTYDSTSVTITDVSDPAAPVHLSHFNISSDISICACVAEETLIVMGDQLFIYDITDKSSPSIISTTSLNLDIGLDVTDTSRVAITALGELLYIRGRETFYCIDISDASAPRVVGSISDNKLLRQPWSTNRSIYIYKNYVYFSSEHGTAIIDIADPSDPQFSGFISYGPQGDYRFTMHNGYIFAISPGNPAQLLALLAVH